MAPADEVGVSWRPDELRTGHSHRISVPRCGPRIRLLALALLVPVLVVLWLGVRGAMAYGRLSAIQTTATRVRVDAKALDFTALSADLRDFRDQAGAAHELTGDPVWGLLTHVPLIGSDASAARQTSQVLDSLGAASAPLAAILPRLTPASLKAPDGRINVASLRSVGPALVAVSDAVGEARRSLAQIDTRGVIGRLSHGITQLRSALDGVAGPLRGAAPVVSALPGMLGADGQRSWFVGLENLAEARGTGGFLGGFAVITANNGMIKLSQAQASNQGLTASPIPTAFLPRGLLNMWGSDLAQWNGLNLSPHFPYTGSLVAAGWAARSGAALDGVLFIDQPTISALLAGTGPITVRGVTLDASNVEEFLTTGLYARFPNVGDKDAVVLELVRGVFAKVSVGQFNLVTLLKALRGPAADGGVLAYSTHAQEEVSLAGVSLGGGLPEAPGPTAMAVINNGSGNKMERYLNVGVDYVQGDCAGPVRTGDIAVTLTNLAPSSGLPGYVTQRNDLLPGQPRPPVGSTREILDVYGPVGSTAVAVSLDGQAAAFSIGVDRRHPTWRVDVELAPGQTRTVEVQFLQQLEPSSANLMPVILAQPMVIPQSLHVEPGRPCSP